MAEAAGKRGAGGGNRNLETVYMNSSYCTNGSKGKEEMVHDVSPTIYFIASVCLSLKLQK